MRGFNFRSDTEILLLGRSRRCEGQAMSLDSSCTFAASQSLAWHAGLIKTVLVPEQQLDCEDISEETQFWRLFVPHLSSRSGAAVPKTAGKSLLQLCRAIEGILDCAVLVYPLFCDRKGEVQKVARLKHHEKFNVLSTCLPDPRSQTLCFARQDTDQSRKEVPFSRCFGGQTAPMPIRRGRGHCRRLGGGTVLARHIARVRIDEMVRPRDHR